VTTGSLEALLKKYKDAVQSGAVQLVGKESSGKSTLAYDIIAQHQKETGMPVLYVDFERSYTRSYAESCGVTTSMLQVARANTTEQGLTMVESFIDSGAVKLVVIDSIAAARPSSEVNKDYEDSMKMASNAGIITRFVNRIVPLADNNDALVLVINQFRMNFNTMSPEKEIPFGGQALKYATNVQIGLTRTGWNSESMDVQALIRKSKVSAPRDKIDFVIRFGKGVAHDLDILELGVQLGFATKSGAWYAFDGIQAQGKENAVKKFDLDKMRGLIMGAKSNDTTAEMGVSERD
jgi:recombination protein RecA